MRKRLIWSLAVILPAVTMLGLRISAGNAAQDEADRPAAGEDDEKRQALMMRKLASTHKIVNGLATEDFELIAAGATELVKIADSAAWDVPNDYYYRYYSENFQQAARGLIEAAEQQNTEKATFSYIHVTISCTACHQHVRDAFRVADSEPFHRR